MAAHILILAGGTGGHIYPALAVADELIARGCKVTWMGTRAGMEARLVPARGIPVEWLAVAGFRGKGVSGKILALWRVLLAVFQANRIIARLKPDVVLGLGGFVAGPGGLVAWLRRVPLIIHEQNRVPGTTNRLLARLAKVKFEAFPGSFPAEVGARCSGNPLRKEIVAAFAAKPAKSRSRADALRILIIGGSQGAAALNQAVPEALARLGIPVEALHQTGERLRDETESLYRKLKLNANVTAFVEDMAAAYQWADLAVCRSGAMTVSELTAAGLPSVLIPFPHAIDDHQTANARYLADADAAVLLPQIDLTPERLAQELMKLTESADRLEQMSRRAAQLAKTGAAREVAEVCMEWAAI